MFVKLHQFDPADRTFVRIDTSEIARTTDPGRPHVEVSPLFEDTRETVQLETLAPDASMELGDPGGFEMLVLDGALTVDGEPYEPQSWLRLPPGDGAELVVGPSPATIWVKRGHLRDSVLNTGILAL
jgi:hypothetical protein